MLSIKFPHALIPLLALSLTNCSVSRNLTWQNRNSQEIKALSEEVGSLEQSVASLRTEIREMSLESETQAEMSETLAVERTIEVYDTDKPVDPALGTPPVKSRTTERSDIRKAVALDERASLESAERVEGRDSSQTKADVERSEISDTFSEAEEAVSEETPPRTTWAQKTLMYIGIAAMVFVVLKLALGRFKSPLKAILAKIKQHLTP